MALPEFLEAVATEEMGGREEGRNRERESE